ncbi:MAG TPA: HD domain-containing protein [Ktedonobacterales bacterium]
MSSTPYLSSLPALDALLALCERYMSCDDLKLIRRAYEAAALAHAGVYRKSGEPYIEHPLAVARILAELAVDAHGIAAALLHDTVEDTPLKIEALREQFGEQIAAIVDGVTKFDAVEAPKPSKQQPSAGPVEEIPVDIPVDIQPFTAEQRREQKAQAHAETVHKLFLAMLEDPRVVLLKLADRLHNMRTMEVMSERQRTVKSQEVLDIYAPLAGRIGLYTFKNELEDLAFAYLHPEEFERTVQALRTQEQRRTPWAERMCDLMRRELCESGIPAAVNWRMKRPYRSWVEAQEAGVRVSALGDLVTFRVLVESVGECYRALGELHRLWLPHERIRDYISNVKNNGYQSLHTAVFALDGHLAPIHIRSHRMHRASQHGVASYWLERAAAGDPTPTGESLVSQMPSWVGQLATWESDLRLPAIEFLSAVRAEVLEEDSIFVFTPRGGVHELPAGATVIDYAYQIHTRVGDQAVGARVQTSNRDGTIVLREVALDYVLQTGDVIYVQTDLRSGPRPEWRAIATTRYAREKISRSLRLLRRETSTASGEAGRAGAEGESEILPLRHPSGALAQVRLARCCDPCPPDEIVGVACAGRGVTIHRPCCRQLRRIMERRVARLGKGDGKHGNKDTPDSKESETEGIARTATTGEQGATDGKTMPVGVALTDSASLTQPLATSWDALGPVMYRLHLVLYGQDHPGLMYELTSCIAGMGLNVVYAKALANQDRGKALVSLTVAVPSDVRRETVTRRLRGVPGVTEVAFEVRKGCAEK